MVAQRRPAVPQAIVVKRGRRSAPLSRTPTCLWPGCAAQLAHDHPEPVCGCHVGPTYNLCHDKQAAATVLHLLIAAYPAAVDLCAVLRCTSDELKGPLGLLRRRGHRICGARRGYVYETPAVDVLRPRRGARRVKP
jgi:hypothetical protein